MRTKESNPAAKERLLDAAQRLMLAKGYTATSVDAICEAAELTKGSFFHYFGSKEDLGKAVLDRYVTSTYMTIQNAPFFKKSDPLQRVYGYIDFMIELSKDPERQNGCLLGNFSQVLSDTHPEIRSLCARHFQWWAEILKRRLDEAKAKYNAGKSVDTQALADHFISLFEGSLMLARTKQDVKIVEKNMRYFKQMLKALFEK